MKTFYTLLLVAFIGVQDGQAQSVQYRTMPRQELENLELKTVKDFENAQDKAKRAESRMKDAKKSYDDFKKQYRQFKKEAAEQKKALKKVREALKLRDKLQKLSD